MKLKMIVSCIPLLVTGCGFHHRLPMYSDYQRIDLGKTPPADIQGNPQWGSRRRTEWRWSTGVTEEARYLLGAEGEVIAKWYRGGGEVGSPLFMWYKGRDKSEGCLLIPASEMSADADILDVLRTTHDQLWSDSGDERIAEAFRIADEKGGLSSCNFTAGKSDMKSLFPLLDRTVWKIRRSGPTTVDVMVEDRRDISLIVWTLFGWTAMLTGNFP